MRQIQRNIEILKALNDIAVQTAGIRHKLNTGVHFGSLESHASRHYQTYIARSEYYGTSADHIALDIHIPLSRSRGVNACGAVTGNGNRAAGTLAAAHRQHYRLRLFLGVAAGAAYRTHDKVACDRKHHAVGCNINTVELRYESRRVFGSGQLLLKAVKSESVVYALVENPAEAGIALDDKHVRCSAFARFYRGGEPGRTSAYYNNVSHILPPDSTTLPSLSFRISSRGIPVAAWISSSTLGAQNPP